jgi:hypothetical protein
MALFVRNFPSALQRQARARAVLAGATLTEWLVAVVSKAVAEAPIRAPSTPKVDKT